MRTGSSKDISRRRGGRDRDGYQGSARSRDDRDGAPRYGYLALPFSGDFVPSLPVRVAATTMTPWRSA